MLVLQRSVRLRAGVVRGGRGHAAWRVVWAAASAAGPRRARGAECGNARIRRLDAAGLLSRTGETVAQAIQREAVAARTGAGLFDGSSLGKIEVHGADAAAFLNLMYYMRSPTWAGRIRYCLILRETGIVFDDGVSRVLLADSYLLSPSSSTPPACCDVAVVASDRISPDAGCVSRHYVRMATFAVSGPACARRVGARADGYRPVGCRPAAHVWRTVRSLACPAHRARQLYR